MALINRITRLFRADMHAVLDRLEEPDVLLRQSVREMEAALLDERRRCSLLQHEQVRLGRQLQELDASLQQLDAELDLCFESRQETLARERLRRKLETQRLHKALQDRQQELECEQRELETRLPQNESRLKAMQQKLDVLCTDTAADRAAPVMAVNMSVPESELDVAFLREQQRRQS